MVDPNNGILKRGREIRLTGCRLRTAVVSKSSQIRLLPTEYLVVLLDEVSLSLISLFFRQLFLVDVAG